MVNETLKKIFVISPIGKTDEDGFDFTELVLTHIIRPAAEKAGGFDVPARGDEAGTPGSIAGKVVVDILSADVCVADLTQRNPNVMYEVAIAHAADKQVILLQQETGGPPFDFTDQRVIHYTTRADGANRARDELAVQLSNADHDVQDVRLASVMNPVRQLFRQLRARDDATEPQRAILDRLDALGYEVARLRSGPRLDRRVPASSRPPVVLSRDAAELLWSFEGALRDGDARLAQRTLERGLDTGALSGEIGPEVSMELIEIAERSAHDPEGALGQFLERGLQARGPRIRNESTAEPASERT